MFGRQTEVFAYELIYTDKDDIFDYCIEMSEFDINGRLFITVPCYEAIEKYLNIHQSLTKNIVDMYGFSRAVDICREDDVDIDELTIQQLYIVLASNVLYNYYDHRKYTQEDLYNLWYERVH